MKRSFLAGVLFAFALASHVAAEEQSEPAVSRFANLALDCVHQEYPNKISHVLSSDKDVGPPRELTPVFYGCFDWHSSVHGHWLLTRLLRLYPDAEFSVLAEKALNESFRAEKVEVEVAYVKREERVSFERPYGVAWLLQLTAELREWDDPRARRWLTVLEPLPVRLNARVDLRLARGEPLEHLFQSLFIFGRAELGLILVVEPVGGGVTQQHGFHLDLAQVVGDLEFPQALSPVCSGLGLCIAIAAILGLTDLVLCGDQRGQIPAQVDWPGHAFGQQRLYLITIADCRSFYHYFS